MKKSYGVVGFIAIFTSFLEVVSVSNASLILSSGIFLVINGLTLMVLDAMRFSAFLKCAGVV